LNPTMPRRLPHCRVPAATARRRSDEAHIQDCPSDQSLAGQFGFVASGDDRGRRSRRSLWTLRLHARHQPLELLGADGEILATAKRPILHAVFGCKNAKKSDVRGGAILDARRCPNQGEAREHRRQEDNVSSQSARQVGQTFLSARSAAPRTADKNACPTTRNVCSTASSFHGSGFPVGCGGMGWMASVEGGLSAIARPKPVWVEPSSIRELEGSFRASMRRRRATPRSSIPASSVSTIPNTRLGPTTTSARGRSALPPTTPCPSSGASPDVG